MKGSGWLTPREADAWLFVCFGIGCGLQQWLLTVSFRYAEASLLAPFEYVAIPLAVVWGYLVWSDLPDAISWLGIAMIISAGLFVAWREMQREQDE